KAGKVSIKQQKIEFSSIFGGKTDIPMKHIFVTILLSLALQVAAQETPGSIQFWNTLKEHCGKAYEGEIIAGAVADDGFTGEKLVMHVRSCTDNIIRIPFFVGDDKYRTWDLILNE